MYYALTEHLGHKFLCVVSGQKGCTELDQSEHRAVVDNLPVNSEWIECVWDYFDPNMETLLEQMPDMEKGQKAEGVLNYCREEGYLGQKDDDEDDWDDD